MNKYIENVLQRCVPALASVSMFATTLACDPTAETADVEDASNDESGASSGEPGANAFQAETENRRPNQSASRDFAAGVGPVVESSSWRAVSFYTKPNFGGTAYTPEIKNTEKDHEFRKKFPDDIRKDGVRGVNLKPNCELKMYYKSDHTGNFVRVRKANSQVTVQYDSAEKVRSFIVYCDDASDRWAALAEKPGRTGSLFHLWNNNVDVPEGTWMQRPKSIWLNPLKQNPNILMFDYQSRLIEAAYGSSRDLNTPTGLQVAQVHRSSKVSPPASCSPTRHCWLPAGSNCDAEIADDESKVRFEELYYCAYQGGGHAMEYRSYCTKNGFCVDPLDGEAPGGGDGDGQ